MPWREGLVPHRMARVAVVAPEVRWRRVLAEVADAGVLEPARADRAGDRTSQILDSLRRAGHEPGRPVVWPDALDLDRAAANEQVDLVAGEAELERVTAASAERHGVRAVAGWLPVAAIAELDRRLDPLGGAVVELALPAGTDPPTQLAASRAESAARPLVDTYATVPYRDLDPAWFAALAYVVMFGMMFGDVGHGALVVVGALWLRQRRHPPLVGARRVWPLVAAMGVSATAFGFLYGEFFGPTGVVESRWLEPLEEPTRLLAAGIGVGAALLAVAYGIGVANRWREGGIGVALYSPTGVAGAGLFVALGLVAGGALWASTGMWTAGLLLGALSLVLVGIGLKAGAGGGAAGAVQASVELVDVVIRLGANIVSFARLAAFGLTHAALGKVVWDATTALWGSGAATVAAIAVFVVGNAFAFALEALVAGVQALRLEYYELFSRIFATEGRPFRPWHVPFAPTEEPT
jgi:V/A-type H+/Na+-transporting ATPase subunit I